MIGLDSYSIPARLFPAVLVLLPLGATIAALFPQDVFVWGAGSGLASTTGLAFLLAERARRPGRAVQDILFDRLGAKPTTILLRHRDNRIDAKTKRRYHSCLAEDVPGATIPSADDEASDPDAADAEFDSCVTFMLERTRNRKQFPLVFKELVSYGMVRNLYAMRSTAIAAAAIGSVACAVIALWDGHQNLDPVAAVGCVLSAGLLAVWLTKLREQWVKAAAFDYARRLLASCDLIKATEE